MIGTINALLILLCLIGLLVHFQSWLVLCTPPGLALIAGLIGWVIWG